MQRTWRRIRPLQSPIENRTITEVHMTAAIRPNRLRAGIFLAPFHPVDEDPTLAIRRAIDLIEHLDRIGFDEACIGEHHSAGYDSIAAPELCFAAVPEPTQRTRP